MQRFSGIVHRRKLFSSISSGIRHHSTDSGYTNNAPTPKRAVRTPMTRLGDIVIPTPAEVRAKASGRQTPKSSVPFQDFTYEPDVSYLHDVGDNSLSAKLVRMGRNEPPARSAPTAEELAVITKKRRLEREARDAENLKAHFSNYVPIPEKSEMLRSQFDKSTAFMSPEMTPANVERRRAWASSRRTKDMGRISPHTNEQRTSQRRRPGIQSPGTPGRRPGEKDGVRQAHKKRHARPATLTPTLSTFDHQVDESTFTGGGHNPEFTGPEILSPTLLNCLPYCSGSNAIIKIAGLEEAIEIPPSKVDSLVEGNYTPYLTAPAEDFGIPPDQLGAVGVTACTLTHQRHYSLPARLRTLELVDKASKPLSKQAS